MVLIPQTPIDCKGGGEGEGEGGGGEAKNSKNLEYSYAVNEV